MIHPLQLSDACLSREADQGENGLAGPAVEAATWPVRLGFLAYFCEEPTHANS